MIVLHLFADYNTNRNKVKHVYKINAKKIKNKIRKDG